MFRSLSVLVLAALVGGLLMGAAIHAVETPALVVGAETVQALSLIHI